MGERCFFFKKEEKMQHKVWTMECFKMEYFIKLKEEGENDR